MLVFTTAKGAVRHDAEQIDVNVKALSSGKMSVTHQLE